MKTTGLWLVVLLLSFGMAAIAIPAQAQTESVLYSFQGNPDSGPDGANPQSGPILVGTTLYGTTTFGGPTGNGIVWSVSTTTGKETIVYSFQGQPNDGFYPYGGLTHYNGSFYGTTIGGYSGGASVPGTIFKISKSGKKYVEKILFEFDSSDGVSPGYVTPVFDSTGNLYGTTMGGGAQGNGAVFRLTPGGVETVLHSFTAQNGDGGTPQSGVTLDKKGNLYGTTSLGGEYGWGTLYEITAAGDYSILYNFTGGDDGGMPYSPPVLDKKGNLYGTTEQEGGSGAYGTVYEFDPKTSKLTILHTFTGYPDDGSRPWAGALVWDTEGNLYGTTSTGGTSACGGVGTIYKLVPGSTETILLNFDCSDGQSPLGAVVFDKSGNLYTTTLEGGATPYGTVIKLTP